MGILPADIQHQRVVCSPDDLVARDEDVDKTVIFLRQTRHWLLGANRLSPYRECILIGASNIPKHKKDVRFPRLIQIISFQVGIYVLS